MNKHFEPVFNTVAATRIVFQRLVKDALTIEFDLQVQNWQRALYDSSANYKTGQRQNKEIIQTFFINR